MTIDAKKSPPITVTHTKGNPFSFNLNFSGVTTISDATAIVYRIGDRSKVPIFSFAVGNGLVIAGTSITLSKTDVEITHPKALYGFDLNATADTKKQDLILDGFFVIK